MNEKFIPAKKSFQTVVVTAEHPESYYHHGVESLKDKKTILPKIGGSIPFGSSYPLIHIITLLPLSGKIHACLSILLNGCCPVTSYISLWLCCPHILFTVWLLFGLGAADSDFCLATSCFLLAYHFVHTRSCIVR